MEHLPSETDGTPQRTAPPRCGVPDVHNRQTRLLARSLFFLSVMLALACPCVAVGAGGVEKKDAFVFKCGENLCDARTSYCEAIKTDVLKLPTTYSCKPLPETCRANAPGPGLKCSCFPRGTHCDFCDVLEVNGVYHLHRMCVGGR